MHLKAVSFPGVLSTTLLPADIELALPDKSQYRYTRMNLAALVVVFLISGLLYVFSRVGASDFFNELSQIEVFGKRIVQWDRCQQKVEFEGTCLALQLDLYQYDRQTQSCIEVAGGGCSSHGPFVSKLDCEQACVPGWQADSARDVLILSGVFTPPDLGRALTFDLTGAAQSRFAIIDGFVYYSVHAAEFFQEKKTIVAVISQVSYRPEYSEELLVLFVKNDVTNQYYSVDVQLLEEKFSTNDLVFKTSRDANTTSDIHTIEYSVVSCGGPQLPSCDQQFQKHFLIDANSLQIVD